ncbi:hypothetical protein EPK99_01815 [Neorhizobium lilium]|uniref:Uncharacterized protein n=1 Tax=Neorhizobium lilium TaxID=2503024 RepID=A0A444LLB3_9HYPH|nr:hypothetical protein [Neorhizobium lilium]RWX81093.1 hypothetical protein EPK99_01815 [Neorhizobium lilium]
MSNDGKQDMDLERFRALVEAYGGDRKRWPEDRREAADRVAATEAGRALVREACRLDAFLALSATSLPPAALTGRILQSADKRITLRRRLQRWLVGAGLVGVGLAGGLTGALAVAVVAPPPQIPIADTATAFGNIMTEAEIAQEIQ